MKNHQTISFVFTWTITVALMLHAVSALAADPAWYLRQDTWHETMRVSREALFAEETLAGIPEALPDFGVSEFTVMAWIRTIEGGVIFSISSAEGRWPEPAGKAFVCRGGKLGFDACSVGIRTGERAIANGAWHHVAMTHQPSSGTLVFYVDGVADAPQQIAAASDTPGHIIRVGHAAPGITAPNEFKGFIDEVRLFDKALPPESVAAYCTAPPQEPDPHCIAYWPFDEDASDASGRRHDGLLRQAKLAEGTVGKALHLDGSGWMDVATDTAKGSRLRLWTLVERDFVDTSSRREMAWEQADGIWDADWTAGSWTELAQRYAAACPASGGLKEEAVELAGTADSADALQAVRTRYLRARYIGNALARLDAINLESLELAVQDLTDTYGDAYPNGRDYLNRVQAAKGLRDRLAAGDETAIAELDAVEQLASQALLENPLLNFDRLLLIQRGEGNLGLTNNWNSNSSLPKNGYDNRIAVLSPVSPDGKLTILYAPEGGRFVGDVDLHWNADTMLFSMPSEQGPWRVFEMRADGTGLEELPLIGDRDVDNYDACYLPDGNLLFCSTASFTGVPCVTGSSHVCHLYRFDRATGHIRRLTFDQDHNWCPTVLNDGRILYLRWEYSDIPHYVSRILFTMNPDGTSQMAHYGSNSYWPNAMFYARPIPDSPTQFAAIVGGHHDVPRMGELVLFDTAKGRFEADGVVQRIPGWEKKVEPIILDGLVQNSWPKFLHPYPLSSKYFLVSSQLDAASNWGIYLVDVFDNRTLIKEVDGYALLEPVPFRPTPLPPVIPSKVDEGRPDATVYVADVYAGKGLDGIPRGTVKQLRLFTYHFGYYDVGGQVNRVGFDGPWDVKRIMGTVPVEPDGSAYFRVPANTPISAQPLDENGQALQLMRSWMTAMPGEALSCAGCHEPSNTTPPPHVTLATQREPSEIAPWYGPTRGFSFEREVQPVLDHYCIACHDGKPGQPEPDLTTRPAIHPPGPDNGYQQGSIFTPSYLALWRFLRVPTIESDMHMLTPGEFHAETMPLIQMLRKGHQGMQLAPEAWDRLITWIDLGAPAHGTWHDIVGEEKIQRWRERRREMLKRYANIDEDPEAILPAQMAFAGEPPLQDAPMAMAPAAPEAEYPNWTFAPDEAARRKESAAAALDKSLGSQRGIDLGGGVTLSLTFVPSGEFVMGGNGHPDEQPMTVITIDPPFWMGTVEVTNAQYARFDPAHDSRLEGGDYLQFSIAERGYPVNAPDQPVCRVSWQEALAFCEWLSATSGMPFSLPTEAQWEYACRAGSDSPLWYGDETADFTAAANLADAALKHIDTFPPWELPSGAIYPWRLAIDSFNDGHRVSAPVGSYASNPWGLFDMHGNVAEWTATVYGPYPCAQDSADVPGRRVVRGGSW
ncbi:MAG: SUMF1/EgtB/PvdO family nonheme iron enzyme, partial [Candidatus Hydrogenedentes bacterium]|nr:SUMF1/EgtB/PvdO family nonheme iron enzyme [Candidatus Hydrogenedentota bacterium]